ncbi:TPA: hypothetical protein SL808_001391 [Pseudomonas aeruginosa]|nr:hypothetical protein [Pseudomonas aeruginosa]
MNKANECTCPSGDGSLRWPCPAHPAVDQADVAAKLTFINGRPAMCGCQVEYSDGGGEYSDVIYVTLCAKHSGSAILDLVATNRIALTPEYEGQWHADLYLDREIPLAKVEGATPAEAVLALMSAERIDPEQESVEQAGGDERVKCAVCVDSGKVYDISGEGPWKCYACTGSHEVVGYANGDELDNMLDDRTAVLSPVKTSFHTVPVYREARDALEQPSPASDLDPFNLAPHAEAFNEAHDEALRPEQAEAERPELWAVHAQGPDELYAAFTREDAEKHAAELNALPMPEGIAVGAVVVPSPWPEAEHWKYLAEQERDHKSEIAVRLRQFERICEGLPKDSIDGGWTVQGIRGYAKLLEDQLKSALARVAELTATRNRYGLDAHYFNKNLQRILRDFGSFTPDELARSLIILAKVADEKVVAQAQHSVPELLEWAVGRWHAEVSLRPLINVHRRALDDTWRQVIRRLGGDTGLLCGPSHDELLAAAPAQGGE